jgi:hypothetical protein
MSILKEMHLVSNVNKTSQIFESLFGQTKFTDINFVMPSDYVEKYWNAYIAQFPNGNASLNGSIFEIIINTLLLRKGYMPLFRQAQVAFVPNVNFDALLFTGSYPICLSIKTSLRERYKQASLEAIAVKYVHGLAKCYLLTMDEKESANVNRKIQNREVLGLDEVIYCKGKRFDDFINNDLNKVYVESKKVDIIKSTQITTLDDYNKNK